LFSFFKFHVAFLIKKYYIYSRPETY